MDQEDIQIFDDELKILNTKIVDIHCLLTAKNLSLMELQNIQTELDALIIKFNHFNMAIDNNVIIARNGIKNKHEKAIKNEKYEKLLAIIPIIGILPALLMALKDYNQLLEVKIMEQYLEKFSSEFEIKIQILKDNIQRKYNLLNQRLLDYVGSYTSFEAKDFTYYDANEIIINYLDNFIFEIGDINPQIKSAMIKLLQRDLKTDCNDLLKLLQSVKEKNNPKKLIKKA